MDYVSQTRAIRYQRARNEKDDSESSRMYIIKALRCYRCYKHIADFPNSRTYTRRTYTWQEG
jgi:hypothetical protein